MLGSCGHLSRVSDQIICARTCAIFFHFYLHILCASHRIATLFIVMFFSSQSREENPEDAVEANKAASIFVTLTLMVRRFVIHPIAIVHLL